MKRLLALLCAMLLCLGAACAFAEGTANPMGWLLLTGLEDGDLICSNTPVKVSQRGNISRTLDGSFYYYIDVPYIWFLMANGTQYGTYNYGPYDALYTVRIVDASKKVHEFVGVVPVGDGMMLLMDNKAVYDRVYYWTDMTAADMDDITALLRSGQKLQVSIRPKDGGSTTYEFTMDTAGFGAVWNSAHGIDPSKGVTAKVTAQQVSLRKADGSFISTLPVGAEILVIGYDKSADMFMVEYNGTNGYIKGAGLSVSRDELLNTFK